MRLMRLEQAAAIAAAIEEFNSTDKLTIREPCDCGHQVRHNNGGNYHDIIRLCRDMGGEVFVMNDTTSELEAPAEWRETNEVAENIVAAYADWL